MSRYVISVAKFEDGKPGAPFIGHLIDFDEDPAEHLGYLRLLKSAAEQHGRTLVGASTTIADLDRAAS